MGSKYNEIPLSKVIKYFVDGYEIPNKEVYDYDYWIDKEEVVIKLYLQDKDKDCD